MRLRPGARKWRFPLPLATWCLVSCPAPTDGEPAPASVEAASSPAVRSTDPKEKANPELLRIYQADQGDRQSPYAEIDWELVEARDAERRARVQEIVGRGSATTSDDYYYAAVVMHHGTTAEHYEVAHLWAMKAIGLDGSKREARSLAAAAKDRLLKERGEPQLYGTQFVREGGQWVLYEVDPNITDEQRAEWNIPPLAESVERARAMDSR